MKTILRRVPRLALLTLPAVVLLFASPLRAQDSDGDPKPKGFFHRLGNGLFKGTRKIERSDSQDPVPMAPAAGSNPKAAAPATDPSTKKSSQKKTLPTVSSHQEDNDVPAPAPVVKARPKPSPPKDADSPVSKQSESAVSSKDADPKAPANDKGSDVSTSTPPPIPKEYPVASHADRPGFVKSPFPPFTMLDATGMISGTLARDPTTGKIFRVP